MLYVELLLCCYMFVMLMVVGWGVVFVCDFVFVGDLFVCVWVECGWLLIVCCVLLDEVDVGCVLFGLLLLLLVGKWCIVLNVVVDVFVMIGLLLILMDVFVVVFVVWYVLLYEFVVFGVCCGVEGCVFGSFVW